MKPTYPKTRTKSRTTSSTVRPSTSNPLITATESAPASITLRAFWSVIPPIATSGLLVSALARHLDEVRRETQPAAQEQLEEHCSQ